MLTSGSELRDPFWWGLQDNMECWVWNLGGSQTKQVLPTLLCHFNMNIYVLSFVCHTQWYPVITQALHSVNTPGMLGIEPTLAAYKANA